MCGGKSFNCSKNALIGLNICYIVVAFILIGVATAGKTSSVVSSLPIIGGIAACGVFLLLVAIFGLVGAIRHHQVMLFFYMIILFLIFIIQFSVACACLAVDEDQEIRYAHKGWDRSSNTTKFEAETIFNCCGFSNTTEGVNCADLKCSDQCEPCEKMLQGKINYAFNAAGGLGLFFAFTEIVGSILAYRYRNMIDPVAQEMAAASAFRATTDNL